MKELKLELLKETVEHYNVNTRSTMPDMGCVYESDTGRNCAMGRIMTPEALEWVKKNGMNSGVSFVRVAYALRAAQIAPLKEKWMPLMEDMWFLEALQSLHDHQEMWDENGLSADFGQRRVEEMSRKIHQGTL